ncbi:plastocyanin/azurin family copper-binding protein [Halococcus sp. AFM35]|uniref:plastocyanin/azurin family copper-binding protein n=1 Tax=Halococcus sp. AFM35 TaxID=3421653 RepID=UPI003EBBCF06
MTDSSRRRRRFLYEAGVALTAGVLAGCTSNGDSSNGSGPTQTTDAGESAPSTATTGTETMTEAEPTTGTATTGGRTTTGSTDTRPVTEPAPQPVDEYLSDANFYDGNMVVGVPFVAVGAPGPKTGFDPAAIKVATGTEVTWEWANDEQAHSVVSASTSDGTRVLDSGRPKEGTRVTYRHTFEEPGIYRYYCGVHRAQTARGAVVVAPGSDVGGPGAG